MNAANGDAVAPRALFNGRLVLFASYGLTAPAGYPIPEAAQSHGLPHQVHGLLALSDGPLCTLVYDPFHQTSRTVTTGAALETS